MLSSSSYSSLSYVAWLIFGTLNVLVVYMCEWSEKALASYPDSAKEYAAYWESVDKGDGFADFKALANVIATHKMTKTYIAKMDKVAENNAKLVL